MPRADVAVDRLADGARSTTTHRPRRCRGCRTAGIRHRDPRLDVGARRRGRRRRCSESPTVSVGRRGRRGCAAIDAPRARARARRRTHRRARRGRATSRPMTRAVTWRSDQPGRVSTSERDGQHEQADPDARTRWPTNPDSRRRGSRRPLLHHGAATVNDHAGSPGSSRRARPGRCACIAPADLLRHDTVHRPPGGARQQVRQHVVGAAVRIRRPTCRPRAPARAALVDRRAHHATRVEVDDDVGHRRRTRAARSAVATTYWIVVMPAPDLDGSDHRAGRGSSRRRRGRASASPPRSRPAPRCPSAALPSSSAVVMPASSDECSRHAPDPLTVTRIGRTRMVSPRGGVGNGLAGDVDGAHHRPPNTIDGQRRGDEQQHHRREHRDRRDEHGGATLGRGLADLFATGVAKVLAQRTQAVGEVDAALGARGEQLVGARRGRLRA